MPHFDPPDDSPGHAETDPAHRRILDLLSEAETHLTPAELTARIARETGLSRREAKGTIRRLVAAGRLAYADRHGRTVVELSRLRAIAMSERVILAPPGISVPHRPGRVVVRLRPGPAFGDGGHPTSALSVRAIDRLLRPGRAGFPDSEGTMGEWEDRGPGADAGKSATPYSVHRVLDVGTGSGILVLVALALGAREGVAVDIDPLAREETRANARLNGMEERLRVSGADIRTVSPPFDLILANLRPPTLRALLPELRRLARPGAGVALSGFRVAEAPPLFQTVEAAGFETTWEGRDRGWAAGTFRYGGRSGGGM